MMLRAITLLLAAIALAQEVPTYRAQSDLVLVPFHVGRDRYYVSDLKAPDVVLLEDGKQRAFTTFESPADEQRVMELVLLFDTHPVSRPSNMWDPRFLYGFVSGWDERISASLLEARVQASVYRYDLNRMERLCRSVSQPRELVDAFQRMLSPIPPGEGFTLPEPPHPAKEIDLPAWTFPAVMATLRDIDEWRPHRPAALVIFAEGQTLLPPALRDEVSIATQRGIPVYSVVLDPNVAGQSAIGAQAPLRVLADSTGGTSFDVKSIDANKLREILESVKGEVLSRYVVGFPLSSAAAPREHKLEVRLVSKSNGKMIGGKRTAVY